MHAHATKHATAPTDTLRHKAPATAHDQVVKQSQRLVSQTFFGAMLKQMHEGPFKSKMFDGGRGGQAFGSMLDQHLADRMARGAGRKLVDSITRQIEKRTGARQEPRANRKVATPSFAARMNLSRYRKSNVPEGGTPHVTADLRA